MAAGLALQTLVLPIQPGIRLAAALLLVSLGAVAPAQAWFGWVRDERAMRQEISLPRRLWPRHLHSNAPPRRFLLA